MSFGLISVCLAVCLGPATLVGQDSKGNLKAEDAAIRAVIASAKIPYTDDCVDWTGRLKRPAVGKDRGEQFPDSDVAKRRNAVYTTTKIVRLDVAASGEMAWEFSYAHADYDVDETPPLHKSFDLGQLRVWKKVNGEWKVAARFSRPVDVPFVAH